MRGSNLKLCSYTGMTEEEEKEVVYRPIGWKPISGRHCVLYKFTYLFTYGSFELDTGMDTGLNPIKPFC